ncbi:hypothetical protein [Vibrio crassostreae]|uniref:hypothetical protein n=1 Tax=Vibrio crassostreae TaxID=246167 RepID=UPI001B31651D|nr:hypothetical protein [Vibrio crassostreae]
MANLVKTRNKWRKEFEEGKKPFSPVLDDYRKNRDSEYWRVSRTAEVLLEYILYLESELQLKDDDKKTGA